MERITYRITLDAHKSGIQKTLQGFETSDKVARRIAVNLTSGGDTYEIPPDHVVAMVYITTPNSEEQSINECTIEGNTIVYDVLPIYEEGISEMQIKLIKTGSDGARNVLAYPRFAVEVTKSGADDENAEHTATFTALENAIAQARSVYESRLIRVIVEDDCTFKVEYADGTIYENYSFRDALFNGNALMSESWAKGETGAREGENTDNSKYYSSVSKSYAKNISKYAEEMRELVDEAQMYSAYTVFNVDFETGELLYVSKNHTFDIDEETGELMASSGEEFMPNVEKIISSQVNEWLDIHPEATTSVQDESLTYKKLVVGTLGYVTPEMFGAVGDGDTDDTEALKACFAYACSNHMAIKGNSIATYCLSQNILIDKGIVVDFDGATIKATAGINMLVIDCDEYYGKISNVRFDCNDKALRGLHVINGGKWSFTDLAFKNVPNVAIEQSSGMELFTSRCHIWGSLSNEFAPIGIKQDAYDCHYEDIVIIDCYKAIEMNVGSHLCRVHGWTKKQDRIENSTFMEINGNGFIHCVDCYSDTFQYGFVIDGTPCLKLTHFNLGYNTDIYTVKLAEAYRPYLFFCRNGINDTYQISVSNSILNGHSENVLTEFCNAEYQGYIDNSTYMKFHTTHELWNASTIALSGNVITSALNSVVRSGGVVDVSLYCKINASRITSKKDVVIGNLQYGYQPIVGKFVPIMYSSTYWDGKVNGIMYGYINNGGQVTITIPDELAGEIMLNLSAQYVAKLT